MPIKIHIDEAFILKVEVSKKNPNFYLLPIHLKTEYYVIIDTYEFKHMITYEVVCDSFTDAAKIETFLQTLGL